jgi:hypothetical protein
MYIVVQIGCRAVQAYDAAGRAGAPVRVRRTTAIGTPAYFEQQVLLAAVFEVRIKFEPEPGIRRRAHRLRSPVINLGRRIAVVVSRKIPGQRRARRVAEFYPEVIIRTRRYRRSGVPFPLLNGSPGYGVGRQNQILAPQGVATSTAVKRIARFRGFGAYYEQVGRSRSRDQNRDER